LVRGRFVMRERHLVAETRGWGRSVHAIQRMPPPQVRHAEQTSAAITTMPGTSRKESAA
jgi:dihydroorotase